MCLPVLPSILHPGARGGLKIYHITSVFCSKLSVASHIIQSKSEIFTANIKKIKPQDIASTPRLLPSCSCCSGILACLAVPLTYLECSDLEYPPGSLLPLFLSSLQSHLISEAFPNYSTENKSLASQLFPLLPSRFFFSSNPSLIQAPAVFF